MSSEPTNSQSQPDLLTPDTDTDKGGTDMLYARDSDSPGLDYWRTHSLPPMTREQTIEAFRQWREEGKERARDRIIRANARFAISVATSYLSSRRTMDELLADAMSGMLRATETFDAHGGHAFITYAVWWMRQYCRAGILEEQRVVRHPVGIYSDRSAVDKAIGRLMGKLERMPTTEELMTETGMSEANVLAALTVSQRDTSLDAPLAGTTTLYMGDMLRDEGPNPEELAELESRRQLVRRLLADLDPRLHYIVERYYGLDGEPPDTLEGVAARVYLTRERTRQIREQAIAIIQVLQGLVPAGDITARGSNAQMQIAGVFARVTSVQAAARILNVKPEYLLVMARRYGLRLPRGYVSPELADNEAAPTISSHDCY